MKLDPTNQFIKAITENASIEGRSILEIGCGSGRITKDLVKYAKSVMAIDPDKQSLKKAMSNINATNICFIEGSGEDLSFLNAKKFDIVLYSLSLHHIPYKQMKLSLIQATNLVSDNGKIIVIEPDKKGSLIEAEEQFNVGDGDELFVKEKAIEAINSLNNWEITKKSYFSTLFYFDNETDFFENMLPSYKSKSALFISKVSSFLNNYKNNNKIVLSAGRNINIIKRM